MPALKSANYELKAIQVAAEATTITKTVGPNSLVNNPKPKLRQLTKC